MAARWRRVRDLLIYAVIAIAIFVAAGIFAVHQARTGGSPNLPVKWIGFAGMTAIVFGYTIRQSRMLWNKGRFWFAVWALFSAHTGFGVFVLLKVSTVPLLVFALLIPLEFAALVAYLNLLFHSPQHGLGTSPLRWLRR